MDVNQIMLLAWALALGGAIGGSLVVSGIDSVLRHFEGNDD